MKKVTIYSTQKCPYCVYAKQFFTDNNIPFEDIDVGTDQQKAIEMIQKSGHRGVPQVEIGNQLVLGFQPEEYLRLLNNND